MRDKYVQPDATIKVDNNGNVSILPPSSGSESNTWRLADQAEPFIDWLSDRWHKSRQQDRNVLNNTLGEKNERRQRYIDNSVYSMRDARTGNAGFDVLVRQPITSDDPKERHDAEQMAKQYAAVNAGAGLMGVGSTSELVPITSDALATTGTASASLVAPGTSLIVPTSYPTVAEVAASSPAWLQNALVGLGLMSTAVPAGIIAHNANEDDSNDNWGKRKHSGPQRNAKKEELLKENELKNWINKKNVDLQDGSWYVEPDGQPQDETTYEGTGLPIGLSNSDPWRIGSFNDEKKRLDKNKKGGANAEPDSSGSEGEGESESRNDRISRWLRYAPAIGTGLQALSDSLGFTNYNDYSNPNMVQRQIDAIGNVNYQPISGYRQFTPLDEEYIANQQASQMEAARRGVANNASGNASAAIAAMQNLNLGQQNNLGDLHVRTAEYNNQIQKEIAEHNMNINRINSSMSMSAQEKNQAIAAEKASLGYKVATLRQMIENANDEAKTANMNSFLTNLGNIGRENFTFNMVNDNPAYYYSIDENGHIRYRNGFWDLGKADRDAIVADAESKLKSRQDKDKKDKEEK